MYKPDTHHEEGLFLLESTVNNDADEARDETTIESHDAVRPECLSIDIDKATILALSSLGG